MIAKKLNVVTEIFFIKPKDKQMNWFCSTYLNTEQNGSL